MSDIAVLPGSAGIPEEQGEGFAFEQLYDELKRLAHAKLKRHQDFTLLDTTSLVHESFLKLAARADQPIQDRHRFFAYAARVMRSVIVDFARARLAERRGGHAQMVTLDTDLADRVAAPPDDVLRVHEALAVLSEAEPRLAQVVEMRYFGGLTEPEVAEIMGVTERTVRRDWTKAKMLLSAVLEEEEDA